MNKIIGILFLLIPLLPFAQKADPDYSPIQYRTTTCRSSFSKIRLAGDNNTSTVEQYIKNTISNLKDYRNRLKLNYIQESPGGFHYSFSQTFQDIEIYQSEIKVNINRQQVIYSVFDNSENTSGWNLNTANAGSNTVIALRSGVPVICTRRIAKNGIESLEANGEVVFQRDMNSYFNQDSMVSGKIFNPDPLTSSQNVYGPPYVDHGDTTNGFLNLELRTVKFSATFTGTQFILENAFVKESDFDPPNIAPTTSVNGQFYFNRSQSGFEDVNAFYHINTVRTHIHSLGFGCADSLVEIDTHAINGDDNSYYSPAQVPNQIFYGTGGVDDAEDADVCVHEYGHFVSNGASPGSNIGLERNSLDEGFGDYLAASYSKSISTYHDNWVFNWDGHNEFWSGRVLDAPGIYPDDLNGSVYHNGQIWSAVLYCLNGAIGRDATDSLILETHYAYSANMSMANAASLLMYSDTLLTGGKYGCAIYNCLFQHGLNPLNPFIQCVLGISEEENFPLQFLNQANSFSLSNPNSEKIQLQILNIEGQLISTIDENQSAFNYNNPNLPSGIYLVHVNVNGAMKTFKWVKTSF